MSKKKLDNLFQEKFTDFKELPDERVWERIEASLDKKKNDRKVIPIWWKLGGIAAALAIGIFVINPFEKELDDSSISNVENEEKKGSTNQNNVNEEIIVKKDSKHPFAEKEQEEKINSKNTNRFNSLPNQQNALGNRVSKKNTKSAIPSELVEQKTNTQTNRLTEREPQNNVIVSSSESDKVTPENQSDLINNNIENTVIADFKNNPVSKNNNSIKNTEVLTENALAENQEDNDSAKKSIFDEINEEEETLVAEKTSGKWSAGPTVAPVYFDAIGGGSPVNSVFESNSKSGDTKLSYGLAVTYELSNKLSIRSGIHRVDYSYNTNDIEFTSSVNASSNPQFANVDYSAASENLVINGNNSPVERTNSLTKQDAFDVLSNKSPSREGFMTQQFGYVEVPLELNYALINNRFGVNVIGGVSSLFLIDNSISLVSGDLSTEIGEANNINAVNFSTNVGLGFNYKFTPKIKLNIEPVFKYQLNTFSDTSGSFRPYSIGIYSGLNFRF